MDSHGDSARLRAGIARELRLAAKAGSDLRNNRYDRYGSIDASQFLQTEIPVRIGLKHSDDSELQFPSEAIHSSKPLW